MTALVPTELQPVAATHEGRMLTISVTISPLPAKSQVTPEMLARYRDRKAKSASSTSRTRNDRAFAELREREAKESEPPVRLTRPQFFAE